MKNKERMILLLLICIAVVSGCSKAVLSANNQQEPTMDMANPASVYCEEQGGVIEMHTDESGMYGICIFDDGSECDEWAFFHGECTPGSDASTRTAGAMDEVQSGASMANPASVYCEEQGGYLELRAGENGMYGVCQFSDGSACEEWAFMKGECQPALDLSKRFPVAGWYGTVISPPSKQPYNYYLVLNPKESGSAGLVPLTAEVETKLKYLRNSNRLAHFWGILNCAVPGVQGCQVEVARVRPEGPGEFFPASPVNGWMGTLSSTPDDQPGSYPDDAFILTASADMPWARLFPVKYGIDAVDPAVNEQLESFRDTGIPFTVFGELTCGVPDTNACQINIERIENVTGLNPTPMPVGVAAERVAEWTGEILSTPEGAQYDDYFEKSGYLSGEYGITSMDPAIAEQIVALRDSGQQIRLWGILMEGVPDYGGFQIEVTGIDVIVPPEAPEIIEKVVEDWVGVVVSTESGAQIDDYFQMMDQNGTRLGIWGEGELGAQLDALRDTDTVIHVWGLVRYNVPDAYNAQIVVSRIEVE